jgi:Glycosyl hydrolases family 43
MQRGKLFLGLGLAMAGALLGVAGETPDALPDPAAIAASVPAPLYRDPVYDGAADPVVVWNAPRRVWAMFYTQRRARLNLPGVEWGHGTRIGVAESHDQGKTWVYRGTLKLPHPGRVGSFWAPDCVRDNSGKYHLFVTFVPGAASTHREFGGQRHILHYSSDDLANWRFEQRVPVSSDYCIDPTLCRRTDGQWWMWFKDERHHSQTQVVGSRDLHHWRAVSVPAVSERYGEGPKVFKYGGHYWMLKDPNCGLDVYRSDDLENWAYQGKILDKPGWRNDDATVGKHADVVVCGDRAYIFYLVEPGMRDLPPCNGIQPLSGRRSAIQAAELEVKDGKLTCDRNKLFRIHLTRPVTR